MRSALPWGLCVAACVAAIWGWSRPAGDTPGRSPATEPDPVEVEEPALEDGAPQALRSCLERLDLLRSACATPARTESGAPAGAAAAPEARAPALAACLENPDVVREVALSAEAIVARRVKRLRSTPGARAQALGLVEARLQFTDEDRRWMPQFVCATRDLTRNTLAALEGGEVTPDQAWQRLTDERRDLMGSLQGYLGESRFQQLRDAGGVGMLADLYDCGEP